MWSDSSAAVDGAIHGRERTQGRRRFARHARNPLMVADGFLADRAGRDSSGRSGRRGASVRETGEAGEEDGLGEARKEMGDGLPGKSAADPSRQSFDVHPAGPGADQRSSGAIERSARPGRRNGGPIRGPAAFRKGGLAPPSSSVRGQPPEPDRARAPGRSGTVPGPRSGTIGRSHDPALDGRAAVPARPSCIRRTGRPTSGTRTVSPFVHLNRKENRPHHSVAGRATAVPSLASPVTVSASQHAVGFETPFRAGTRKRVPRPGVLFR